MDVEGWSKSALDGALWVMWNNDTSSPIGMVIAHVDDLLFMGDDVAGQSLMRLGQKLGFRLRREGRLHLVWQAHREDQGW